MTDTESTERESRCPECGTVPSAAWFGTLRRRGRRAILVATLLTIVIAGVKLALMHGSRYQGRVGWGIPMGRLVPGSWTLADLRAVASGARPGAGLFDGLYGIGEVWSFSSAGDLRLWIEFGPPNTAASTAAQVHDWLGVGKFSPGLGRTPILFSEIKPRRNDPDRDRWLGERLVFIADQDPRPFDATFVLKSTPDPESRTNGTH